MAAYLGTYGPAGFGGDDLPRPGAQDGDVRGVRRKPDRQAVIKEKEYCYEKAFWSKPLALSPAGAHRRNLWRGWYCRRHKRRLGRAA